MSHYDTLGVPRGASPSEIKWSFDLANPDKPDETVVREVSGSDYARAPVQHQWGALADRCERCGLVRELVEDFAPDCGEPIAVRDAVIAALCRAMAKVPVVTIRESPRVIDRLRRTVSDLTDQLQGADIALRNASDSYLEAVDRGEALATSLQRMTDSYELSCDARDQLRSRVRILEEDNARLKTELDRHPWARRMVR